MPITWETYKHYKWKLYKVRGIAKHSETLEDMVVYECLYENPDGQIWVRPFEMWNETVVIDWVEMKRFQLVTG